MKVHNSLTTDRIIEAVHRYNTTLDNPGFCIKCGHEQEECEPDAENYTCNECGEKAVYGAEQLLLIAL